MSEPIVELTCEQVVAWLRADMTACEIVNDGKDVQCYRCRLSGQKKPCSYYFHRAAADAIEREVGASAV